MGEEEIISLECFSPDDMEVYVAVTSSTGLVGANPVTFIFAGIVSNLESDLADPGGGQREARDTCDFPNHPRPPPTTLDYEQSYEG